MHILTPWLLIPVTGHLWVFLCYMLFSLIISHAVLPICMSYKFLTVLDKKKLKKNYTDPRWFYLPSERISLSSTVKD